MHWLKKTTGSLLLALCGTATASPAIYNLDPDHTFPSFEADHMGISLWRGKFNKSTGQVLLDKTGGAGTVKVTIDLASVDFGQDALNVWMTGPEFFDVAKFPTATYTGKLDGFANGAPTRVVGDLTLHGVTKPVPLTINSFKCIEHPMLKRNYCGADALATFNREEFGLSVGKDFGFSMNVTLRIQVEAIKAE